MKFFPFFLLMHCFFFSQAQPHETYKAVQAGATCPNTILLYADGSYVYQTGCEPSPQVSFGQWTKEKDLIRFVPVNPKTFAVVKNVEAALVPGDSIWLTILDKNGLNLSAKLSVGLEVSGRGSYLFSNDASGTKKVVYRRKGVILFRTLNKLFGQRIELPADSANNFVVTLNFSADWINSTHAQWNYTPLPPLQKKADALTTIAKTNQPLLFQKQNDK